MKSSPPTETTIRVLLVDSDTKAREEQHATLNGLGFHVLLASNRHQAAFHASEDEVDVVLMNMLMPHAEGIGTIIALRAVQPEIKIIAMSGSVNQESDHFMPLAKSLGATALLRNPSDGPALAEAVRCVLAPTMERVAC